jgi:hypothetical protein
MAGDASAIFDIIAPRYASDPDKADFISLARDRTRENWYSANYEMAVALRAAHMIAFRDLAEATGGTGGEIASKREGDLGVSFHRGSGGGASELARTSYGQQLLGLRKASGAFIGVTGGLDDGSHC